MDFSHIPSKLLPELGNGASYYTLRAMEISTRPPDLRFDHFWNPQGHSPSDGVRRLTSLLLETIERHAGRTLDRLEDYERDYYAHKLHELEVANEPPMTEAEHLQARRILEEMRANSEFRLRPEQKIAA